MLRSGLAKYEAFLGIDPRGKAKDVVRARALVWFGWVYVLIQAVNLVNMTLSYGGWTSSHTIAVMVIGLLLLAVHSFRYYKNYAVYGFFIIALAVSGVLASALPDHTGINTSLLPILIMTPMLTGFVAGPRIAFATGGAMLAAIGVLYYCSAAHGPTGEAIYSASDLQRAVQAGFVVIMVTVISTVFSANIFRAFSLLEANVVRIREAEAAKSRFLATMSHELRTPLNGVLGLSEVMRKTALDPEQARLMKDIEGSGRSLLTILNDILDMLNIDAEEIVMKPVTFGLRDMVKDVAAAWRVLAEEKGLKLEYAIAADAPLELIGDELRIRQILTKIVSNAVKYTQTGGVVISAKVMTVDNGAAKLQVAVKDTGPGVPEGSGEVIFNAFEQAESGLSRSQDGAGLGLAICKKLATLMGGEIYFDTEMGAGTTFYFTTPIEVPEQAVARAPEENTEGALAGARVLVVEDNIVNRMVAERLLKSLGVETGAAEDGAQCLEMMKKQQFDAILMDKHMPVMDGVKATAEIRAMDEPVCKIPIIACTADAMGGEREALLEVGFDELLPKPISSDDLRNAFRLVLGRKAAADMAVA